MLVWNVDHSVFPKSYGIGYFSDVSANSRRMHRSEENRLHRNIASITFLLALTERNPMSSNVKTINFYQMP